MESVFWHYPPDLVELLVETLPRLVRGKEALIAFLEGAGISDNALASSRRAVRADPRSITKFAIVRQVVAAINADGDKSLRARRELIRRVVEFTAFDRCYPNDAMAARGGVSAIKDLVNLKDNLTKTVDAARERREEFMLEADKRNRTRLLVKNEREAIANELARLFSMKEPVKRGFALESLLNRLFLAEHVSVREPFRLVSAESAGVIEQVDGVIEIDGNHYLVEIKWWSAPLGVADVAQHMVRVFQRGQSRGLFIVYPGYTAAAVESVRKSLHQAPFVLAVLEELVHVFRTDVSVITWLRKKITAAIANENPFCKFSGEV